MSKLIMVLFVFTELLVFGTIDRIQKAMEKKEYDKALELIYKGYEKEPENPGISYYHAKLFFDSAYENYNIDTARVAIVRSKILFDTVPQKLKEKIADNGITIDSVNQLFDNIRDQAFENTLGKLSIPKLKTFQSNFPNSVYQDILTYKMDSMEFRLAKESNSQTALKEFIENHTASIFTPKADSILDYMKVSDLEKEGALTDYYSFLLKYPNTRHRRKLENYILKVSTASHREEKYEAFIAFTSTPALQKKAADVKYYLNNRENNIFHPESDSLLQAYSISHNLIYPVIDRGLLGFYDQLGKQQISNLDADILEVTKCQLTSDDWIFAKKLETGFIISKSGQIILQNVNDYRSISLDVGLAKHNEKWFLYHKSGFKILDKSVQDAEVIANKWIKVKQKDKWGLVTFLGLPISESIYDDIFKTESFWVFEKNGLLAVYTEELILKEIQEKGLLLLEFKFDDIELVNENTLIGFRDDRECLLDSTLNFLIPWGTYQINPESSRWYIKSDQGYRLYNESDEELMNRYYPYLESNEGWLALKTETDWMLIPRSKGMLPSRAYDSIKIVNSYSVILTKGNSMSLLFSSGKSIPLQDRQVRIFQNYPQFISISGGTNTAIYDEYGKPLLNGKFESLTFLNDSLVRVQIRGKQGMVHINGKLILKPIFDSIDEKDGLILTLVKGKIGCYDPKTDKLYPTEYETRLERLRTLYLAKKNGKYGAINYKNSMAISFSYDQIEVWNDTSYLVKKDNQFLIINQDEESVYEPIESIKFMTQNEKHSTYRYVKDGKYGLISSQYGELLDPEFTDIFNIGSQKEPLFFADQNLDKAGFHVVSYVNETGKVVLSRAYTQEEFDKILCDN